MSCRRAWLPARFGSRYWATVEGRSAEGVVLPGPLGVEDVAGGDLHPPEDVARGLRPPLLRGRRPRLAGRRAATRRAEHTRREDEEGRGGERAGGARKDHGEVYGRR